MRRGWFALSLATLALFAAAPASALLSEKLGDSTITVDSDTGLEWLDLTETNGMALNAVLASSLVTVDGFRLATLAEVETLFTNAGFVPSATDADPFDNIQTTDLGPAADLLLDLLGCVQFCGTDFAQGRGYAANGADWASRPFYRSSSLNRGAAALISLQVHSSNWDLEDAFNVPTATFLVRNMTPAPEPAAAVAFAVGFLVVGTAVRKSSRSRR